MAAPPPSPAFHVNLGDLPTWLGVLAASVAATFVYLQLRSQQKEIARQVAALERVQADEIDVLPDNVLRRGTQPGGTDQFWALEVSNASRRPIREVAARIEPDKGAELQAPAKAGFPGMNGLIRWGDFTVPRLVRSKVKCGFYFHCSTSKFPDARMIARFTDDAGLHWEIDHHLHLQKLDRRDW